MASAPKTIALDFDGVIHAYSEGWKDGSCYDPPIEGTDRALREIMAAGYSLVIFTTREPWQVLDWFTRELEEFTVEIMPEGERFWNKKNVIGIANHQKPVAWVYVDDRGLRFFSWAESLEMIHFLANNDKRP